MNIAPFSKDDSVSVGTELVSVKTSVIQINFFLREVAARAGVVAGAGVVEYGADAEKVLSLAVNSTL